MLFCSGIYVNILTKQKNCKGIFDNGDFGASYIQNDMMRSHKATPRMKP